MLNYESIRVVEKGAAGSYHSSSGIRYSPVPTVDAVMVKETLGDDWLTPDLFRFGASTLVNDVLMQIVKNVEGNYQGADYFSLS